MKLPFAIPAVFTNKYLIALIAFALWMAFFDKDNLMVQAERKASLRKLEESKTYFTAEIEKERTFAQNLKNNPVTIEKYARERYLMKRDNEDLYIIKTDPKAEE